MPYLKAEKEKPYHMPEDEDYNTYSFLLNKTARKVKQYAQKRFKELNFGITVDQWAVLKAVAEHEAISQSELAKLTFKDTPTLTRIIFLLEERKLLQRSVDANDRRRFRIWLTEKGAQKVDELRPQIASIRKQAWQRLNSKDFEHFKHILETIYQNLDGEGE